jgi:hypothetical protein
MKMSEYSTRIKIFACDEGRIKIEKRGEGFCRKA